ncbi:hypothetical protein MFMK1_001782 [Metallumcola ferriviriculae]|uniref:Toxin n=1 Tax=Metallumcola ferriviriculae TaxID=3039180 RepID=A0AAU0UP11_9FIRM|nr:hypothetical protein MFMK1_001782 [Desulfitibacteraceae bacterium MK1]
MPYQYVEDFLDECGKLIDARQVDPFTNNPETKATLNILGYNPRVMLQEIKELEPDTLYKGPVPDIDSKYLGNVWIFKKDIQGYVIYIKLKIRIYRHYRELFVMSFHIDRPRKN